jgi:uncharacterized protein YjiS (DUF1127 family)
MFLTNVFAAFARWHRSREAIRMLHGFSDCALRDIGLDRAGLADVVWHGR